MLNPVQISVPVHVTHKGRTSDLRSVTCYLGIRYTGVYGITSYPSTEGQRVKNRGMIEWTATS